MILFYLADSGSTNVMDKLKGKQCLNFSSVTKWLAGDSVLDHTKTGSSLQ